MSLFNSGSQLLQPEEYLFSYGQPNLYSTSSSLDIYQHALGNLDPPNFESPNSPITTVYPSTSDNSLTSNPSVRGRSNSSWSQSEDSTLVSARASRMEWKHIQQQYFPSKSANACRKRYERLQKKKDCSGMDKCRLQNLAKAYMDRRESIWAPLALVTGENWRTIEEICMKQGLEGLNDIFESIVVDQNFEPTSPITPVAEINPNRLYNGLRENNEITISEYYDPYF